MLRRARAAVYSRGQAIHIGTVRRTGEGDSHGRCGNGVIFRGRGGIGDFAIFQRDGEGFCGTGFTACGSQRGGTHFTHVDVDIRYRR